MLALPSFPAALPRTTAASARSVAAVPAGPVAPAQAHPFATALAGAGATNATVDATAPAASPTSDAAATAAAPATPIAATPTGPENRDQPAPGGAPTQAAAAPPGPRASGKADAEPSRTGHADARTNPAPSPDPAAIAVAPSAPNPLLAVLAALPQPAVPHGAGKGPPPTCVGTARPAGAALPDALCTGPALADPTAGGPAVASPGKDPSPDPRAAASPAHAALMAGAGPECPAPAGVNPAASSDPNPGNGGAIHPVPPDDTAGAAAAPAAIEAAAIPSAMPPELVLAQATAPGLARGGSDPVAGTPPPSLPADLDTAAAGAPLSLSATVTSSDASGTAIRLSADELGTVEVRLGDVADGTGAVTVSADRADTLHALAADRDRMQAVLAEAGVDPAGRRIEYTMLPDDGGTGAGGRGTGGAGSDGAGSDGERPGRGPRDASASDAPSTSQDGERRSSVSKIILARRSTVDITA